MDDNHPAEADARLEPVPTDDRRAPLSRERLLGAAVALVDADGLGALTMRALADAVGVKPMSLYHHVRNKDEILDLLVDAVFAEVALPHPGDRWRPAMTDRARSMRAALGRHSWAIGLLESRRNAGPATLQHHDAVLGVLRRDGFTVAAAAHAYALLDSYVYGFALQEATLPFDGPETMDDVLDGFDRLVGDAYPYLAEMLHQHVQQPGYDFADEFEIGLDVVLDGIGRLRAAGRRR